MSKYSEEQKAIIIREYEKSGLTGSEYCRQRGIGTTSLWKWQNAGRRSGKLRAAEFVEIGSTKSSYYELQGKGWILRVPSTESVNRIAELVEGLS